VTASQDAASGRLLAMVTEFCTPNLPGAQASAAGIQAAIR
jgi:D-alanyl-D-alanine carboxypeptidase